MKMAGSSPLRLENTVGKGEIARYEQFLLSHSVFKRPLLQTRKNQGLFGKGLIESICRQEIKSGSEDGACV